MARGQHGYVTRQQLRACGLSGTAIARLVARGYLIRVHQGVFAVGHEPGLPLCRAHAALLACGRFAVLGRGSALSLRGQRREWRMPFEVLTPSGHRRRGIRTHRVGTLAPRDVTTYAGLPVTTIARTVFDVASAEPKLSRLINDARNRHGLQLPALAELAARLPTHASVSVLRPFLGRDHGPTRSELEDRFVWLVGRYGLPAPQLNVPFRGRVLDALYAEQRLIVELDSLAWHADPETFESDRERDAEHLGLGLATVRITWERMHQAPGREAERLEQILAGRG